MSHDQQNLPETDIYKTSVFQRNKASFSTWCCQELHPLQGFSKCHKIAYSGKKFQKTATKEQATHGYRQQLLEDLVSRANCLHFLDRGRLCLSNEKDI